MKLHIGGEEKKEGWKILNIQKKSYVNMQEVIIKFWYQMGNL